MAEFGLTDNQLKLLEALMNPVNKDKTNRELAALVGIKERYVRALRNSEKYRRFQEVLLEEGRRLWKEMFIKAMPDIVETTITAAKTAGKDGSPRDRELAFRIVGLDVQRVEHTGKDGRPVEHEHTVKVIYTAVPRPPENEEREEAPEDKGEEPESE